jgi:Calpain family cysteine protease
MQLGRDGIYGGHAYSVLRAVNYGKERLVLMKNPWGESEWNGPWSDGSSQWTPESIRALDHTFGNDGVFWIRYEDMLRKYDTIYKTRLFSEEWKVTQQWISLAVPWAGEYQDTKFEVTITKDSPTVFILSKLDERYFKGLTGQYKFALSFRIHKAGEEDYVMRTFGGDEINRSVSSEVTLEAGTYEVRVKIIAVRDENADTVEQVLKDNWLDRRDKLLQVGQAYDLAHAKAQLVEDEKPKEAKPKKQAGSVTKESVATEEDKTEPPKLEEGKAEVSTVESEKKDVDKPEASTTGTAKTDNDEKEPEKPTGTTTREVEKAAEEAEGKGGANTEEAAEDAEGEEYYYAEDDKPADTQPLDERPAPPEQDKPDAPWNAVVVVGLRVYCEEGDASIKIVRPKPPVVAKKEKEPVKLDVDDPARDAAKGEDVKTEEKKEVEEEKIEEKKDDDKKEAKKEEVEETKEEAKLEDKEKAKDNKKEGKNENKSETKVEKKNGSGDSDEYVDVKNDEPAEKESTA